MGAEALCLCQWPGGESEVKALLETRDLILRGTLSRKLPFSAITELRVEGDRLRFSAEGEAFALLLGADRAARWAAKIANPPSLATKLGLGPALKVQVIGVVDDPALAEALVGAVAEQPTDAGMTLAIVTDEPSLRTALGRHEATLPGAAIWIVHGKGRSERIGDNAVRTVMRGLGYIDTKISAVSGALSATRYTRRAAQS
jgi:hypothetical protein